MYSYCKLKISFNDGDTNIYNKCIITENLYGSSIETEQGTLNMLKVIKIEKLRKDLEILEIIKKSIIHKYLFSKKIECLNSMVIGLSISEDTDFKKIKEWLENE